MSWPTSTLGEVCEVVSGATPKTGNPDFWDGEIPWVTPKDLSALNEKYLSDTSRKITETGLRSCSARMLPAYSVLFSSRAPIGLVAINTLPVCTNQGFKSMVPRDRCISSDYLYWWLSTHRENLQRKGRGATFKEVSKKIVEAVQIPLPPLAEQKRIAGILDAADALRAKRRESLAQLDTLLQSTFLDMFGDPVANPMRWEVVPLLKVAELENGDRSSNYPSGPDIVAHGTLFLSTKNIVDYHLVLNSCQYITQEKFDSLSRGKLKRNDIVITLRGTLGSCAVFDCQFETGFINAQILIIRAHGTETQYLQGLLSSRSMHDHFSRIATGAAVKQLTGKQIGALAIPLPPRGLQRGFASIVQSVEQQKARLHAHLDKLDNLFASLQSRAFRGEL